MPPKLRRRPAAGAGIGRARPAGVAKAKVRVRPPGRGGALRRPAGAEAGAEKPEKDGFKEVWKAGRGEWLDLGSVEIGGSYWKEKVKVAGNPLGVKMEEGEAYLSLRLTGTTSEQVLKWASGLKEKILRVHLCSKECGGETCEDGLLHAQQFREVRAGGEEGWMKNLEEMPRDEELGKLREEAAQLASSSDSSRSEDRKRKKKSKRKKERKRKRSSSSPREEGSKAKDLKKDGSSKDKKGEKLKRKSKEKKRSGSSDSSKGKGGKEGLLKLAFKGTGLDPNHHRRRKVMKKARRLAKSSSKKSKKGDSEGSSSETSSSSSKGEMGEVGLFPEDIPAKRIWSKFPGALTGGSIREMQNHLLTHQGQVWELDSGKIPPVALQYFRMQLAGKMQPAMRREALHLALVLDLGLQAKFPELLDVVSQRLKALESQASGNHYTVTSKMELVPQEQGMVATPGETEKAARLAREDWKIKAAAVKPHGSQSFVNWESKGGKGDPKGKGKGKGKNDRKGGNPDYTVKGDAKEEEKKEWTKKK